MEGNVSLNECLEVPEAFFTDLFSVLVRFRCHNVAMIADIEKAFLRIGIKEEDRDALRVIWVVDPFAEELEEIILRFTRVTFGVGPSMWHLGVVIKHHLKKYEVSHPDIVSRIEESLYADDFSGGEDNDERAIRFYLEARRIFKEAGMNLRKWRSNSKKLMRMILQDENGKTESSNTDSYAEQMLNPTDQSPVKVLGTPWDLEEDRLKLTLEKVLKKGEVLTKRQLVSASSSIYDVIGGLAPVVFYLKTMFQRICKDGGSWDDKLSQEIMKDWNKWINGAKECPVFEIPRCYDTKLSDNSKIMLIGFCDASEKGYAAVVYLRVASLNGDHVSTNLVAVKTRVAPIVKQSIPRLELLAALLLAILMLRIREIFRKSVVIERELC